MHFESTQFKVPKRDLITAFLSTVILVHAVHADACGKKKSGYQIEGYYEGQLEVFEKFQESTAVGALGFRGSKLVGVTVKRTGWDGTIEFQNVSTGQVLMEPIQILRKFSPKFGYLWKTKMKIEGLQTELKLRMRGDCFEGSSYLGDYLATICMSQNRSLSFYIRKRDFSPVLILHATPYSKPHIPENRPLTLKQVIQIALETNPASQEEFLQKRAAREFVELSWLRLLPRVSGPLVASLWFPVAVKPQTYAQNIGAVAPFLSINAWDAIDEARKRSEIVDIGFRIFQANLVNQVEQAVYTYRKDIQLNSECNQLLDKLKKAQAHVGTLKNQSWSEVSDLKGLINTLQTTIGIVNESLISNNLPNDRYAIAQSLGIHDLEIIRDIKLGSESIPIETATPRVLNSEVDRAAVISLKYLERLQAQKVSADARDQKNKHFLKLFDFAGDSRDGIGFNLISEFKLDDIQVENSLLNEQIVGDQLRFTVSNAVVNYNDAIEGYQNALTQKNQLKERLEAVLKSIEELSLDRPRPLESIEVVVKDYLNFMNLAVSYHAAFRIARATLERANLLYDYEQFIPETDRTHSGFGDSQHSSQLRSERPPQHSPQHSPQDDEIVDDNQNEAEQDTGTSYYILKELPDAKRESQTFGRR